MAGVPIRSILMAMSMIRPVAADNFRQRRSQGSKLIQLLSVQMCAASHAGKVGSDNLKTSHPGEMSHPCWPGGVRFPATSSTRTTPAISPWPIRSTSVPARRLGPAQAFQLPHAPHRPNVNSLGWGGFERPADPVQPGCWNETIVVKVEPFDASLDASVRLVFQAFGAIDVMWEDAEPGA
jgi:hypothetical protein